MPTGRTWTPNTPVSQPDVYVRFRRSDTSLPFPRSNTVGVLVRSDFGPLNTPTEVTTLADLATTFGAGGTVDTARWVLLGGAQKALVVRQGTGGTKATLSLNDAVPAAAVRIDAASVGVGGNALAVTNQQSLDPNKKEVLVYQSGVLRQTIPYKNAAGGATSEGDEMVAAINASASPYVTATKLASPGAVMPAVTNQALATGANPTVDGTSFSNALDAIAPSPMRAFVTESEATTDFATVLAWLNSQWAGGSRVFGVVGQPTSVAAATRRANAAALNSEKMVYVGNGVELLDGTTVEGYRAAAWVAGRFARLGYADTLTGEQVDSATGLVGGFSSTDVDRAIASGMLVFRVAPEGGVEITYDRTTLVNPTGELDDGWMYLQRGSVRTVFLDRIARGAYKLKSRVKNDANGRAAVRQVVQSVADAMVRERALHSDPYPVISDDPDNPAAGDRYYFVARGDDLPPINFVFGTVDFRLTPPATTAEQTAGAFL